MGAFNASMASIEDGVINDSKGVDVTADYDSYFASFAAAIIITIPFSFKD